MHDAEILEVLAPPLFFCGIYYRRCRIAFEGGLIAERNILFPNLQAAQNAHAGDTVIL